MAQRVEVLMLPLGATDRADDAPPFRQIAAHLREAIRRDDLSPGDRLPSESQLVGHCDVARMTVRQAIGELRVEGLVVAEHGRGSCPPVGRLAVDRSPGGTGRPARPLTEDAEVRDSLQNEPKALFSITWFWDRGQKVTQVNGDRGGGINI
jgi:DNA-binding transcriptional MocR family regulator